MGKQAQLVWAVLCLPFLSDVPALDYTLIGNLLRALGVAGVVFFACWNAKTALKNIPGSMVWFVFYMLLIGVVSTVSGVFYDRYVDLSQVLKFYVLNVCLLLVAMSYGCRGEIEKIFKWYYLLCLFAACQAVAALLADHMGIRQFAEIAIDRGDSDYHYMLSWYGLLGGDVWNNRTNFYFSESTHFAQFLFPGIAYSLAYRKTIGAAILLAGFATTFSAFAGMALGAYLLVWYVFYSKNSERFLLFTFAVILVGLGYVYVSSTEFLFERLFERDHSILDKLNTYAVALQELSNHPLGVGPFTASQFYGEGVNTSGGIFSWVVWFGWLAFPALFALLYSLVSCARSKGRDRLLVSMSLCLFFMTVATISHGPLPKYYMVFFYGLLFRYKSLNVNNLVVPSKGLQPVCMARS
jgi:hypothetical protein